VTPVTLGEAFVMSDAATGLGLCQTEENSSGALLRTIVIGLTAFLTVVDLFTPAAMGSADALTPRSFNRCARADL
jgi:hypothetical protein